LLKEKGGEDTKGEKEFRGEKAKEKRKW